MSEITPTILTVTTSVTADKEYRATCVVASGIFGVAVAAFLVALCPDTIRTLHHGRQTSDLPVCPSDDNGEIILFPKPENCSEFYQCSDGFLFTQHCPENLYYCAEKEVCSWSFEPNCTFDCVITKTNPAPLEQPYDSTADPVCPEHSDKNLTLIPNPNNCSAYYECDNGVPVPMGCPDGLYFCNESQICTWVWEPGCTFDCKAPQTNPVLAEQIYIPAADPVCPEQADKNLTLIANPNNCSAYYECDNGLPVPMGCPDDLQFCSEKQICTWALDADCSFKCTVVKKEAPLALHDTDDTVNAINNRNQALGTTGKRLTFERYFKQN
ncbi:hypothetical protein Cfor_03658 [Coptotermes formosanus]|uniref:Chitin-binding type-2 domain-containing protein n=1 Tax=Coptotermes formosanus TaxID=36987 RepID=A0A6L2PTY1_COPFO|nr:hypothetical protein Cfor_03658 [Coptotermes formosanus]